MLYASGTVSSLKSKLINVIVEQIISASTITSSDSFLHFLYMTVLKIDRLRKLRSTALKQRKSGQQTTHRLPVPTVRFAGNSLCYPDTNYFVLNQAYTKPGHHTYRCLSLMTSSALKTSSVTRVSSIPSVSLLCLPVLRIFIFHILILYIYTGFTCKFSVQCR